MRYLFIFWVLLVLFIIIVTPRACTNEKATREALLDAGYHPIEIGGYAWFSCSKDDYFATKFTAYSPDSTRIVKGCVCSGLFKGKTIRLD